MRLIRLVGGPALVLLLTACVALPSPSSLWSLAGSPRPSTRLARPTLPPPIATPLPPTAPPRPTIPVDLSATAVVEQDGVRITVELERNPMPAGQPTSIETTITNTGRDPVVYVPCGEIMSVSAGSVGPPWRRGRELPNPALIWKSYLLDQQGLNAADRSVFFFAAGQTGEASGCGDVAHVTTLAPGRAVHERQRWDGYAFRQLAPPPTARIDLVGRFSFDRGDPLAEHPREDRHTLEVHLDTWILGLPDTFLDPADAADIALTDARLSAILASRDLRNGNEGVVRFEPKSGVYQIGMLESGNLPVSRAHLVLVDARTGEILGFVERDWDYQVDGYP
ncbi:MAG: hypothetical protein ABIZ72_02060 [Candidatus Limnocylindrales bacterium]